MTGLCECGCGTATEPAPYSSVRLGWVRGEPKRFINGHNGRRYAEPKDIILRRSVRTDGCWLWQGALHGGGYGVIGQTKGGNTTMHEAHRFAYEAFRGPIPAGLHVHHVCSVRHCVNPEHMELVTQGEHNRLHRARRTHCPHGHPLDGLLKRTGSRYCKTCARERGRRKRVAARA